MAIDLGGLPSQNVYFSLRKTSDKFQLMYILWNYWSVNLKIVKFPFSRFINQLFKAFHILSSLFYSFRKIKNDLNTHEEKQITWLVLYH